MPGRGKTTGHPVPSVCSPQQHCRLGGRDLGRPPGKSSFHPLDPLTTVEILSASAFTRVAKDLGPGMRFETVVLDEPTADELAAHGAGGHCMRRAFVAVYDVASGSVFEATICLETGELLSWTPRPGARPRFAEEELLMVDAAVHKDARFQAALAARGLHDQSLVCADAWSTSVLGDPLEQQHRLAHTFIWVRNRELDNQYAHPVEGLNALVDVNTGQVVRVDDHGVVPVPRHEENYATRFLNDWRPGLKPIEIVQPEGASFAVDGHEVTWCGWRFRIGFTPREGVVLHNLSIRDGGRWRPVVRRAALAEMLVPYGSPRGAHRRKNAFDCGEYGIGALANSLRLGCDCLGVIRYFDAAINRIDGTPHVITNAICLHEEDTGILWKHTDFRTGEVEVRRARRLVVSFIATVGNYEYAFYWYLYLDGTIELEVKLTGIIFTSAVAPDDSDPHGVVVSPGVVGHIHQHLFNVRLDMEVDGPDNSILEVDTILDPPGPGNLHGNAVRLCETLLASEKAARRNAAPERWRFWAIVNRKRSNRTGRPTAYRLVPRSAIRPAGHEMSQVALRGGFTRYHLWVTPTSAAERWPAGDYVNQSGAGQGLPAWTEADRSVTDRPITIWHTFGHHHVPRPEDFPIQTAMSCGFRLEPYGFFERNPTLDVPPASSTRSCHA